MSAVRFNLNPVRALCCAICCALASPVLAGPGSNARLDALYDSLETAPPPEAIRLGREIQLEAAKSGSPAMNLLLKRGRDALAAGNSALAIALLSALTDHAPAFAEGWHARSIAYAQAGKIGPAMSDLEQALALDPRSFTAIYSLGALLEEVGQTELAYEAYMRVSAIHPYFEDISAALERLNSVAKGSDL